MSKALTATAAKVRAARSSLAAHEADIARDRGRVAGLEAQQLRDNQAFEALAQKISDRNLRATLAGKPLPAADEEEGRLLRQLQASQDAAAAAIPVIETTIASKEKALVQEQRRLSDAFWPWKAACVEAEVAAIKGRIAGLIEPLATLVAVDEIQREILGDRFVTSAVDRAVLASSKKLVDRFMGNLPERLKPDCFAASELGHQASALAAQMKTTLEPDHG